MNPARGRPWSRYALVVIFVCITAGRILVPDPKILSWDNFGYYLYLPNCFIYHDPGMNDLQRVEELRQHYGLSSTLYQVYLSKTGHNLIRYSMGNAVFYSPFFFAAHFAAPRMGYQADGFSRPYQAAVMYGSLLYALLSLVFARKILLRFLGEQQAALTLLLLYLGTNLYHMLANSNGHTHANLFFAYTALLWYTLRWHESPRWRYALAVGFFAGLAIITRPTEIVCLCIPVLWGVYNRRSLIAKIRLVWSRWYHWLGAGAVMVAVGIPQMLYWKAYAGHYLYRSYNNPGEGLDIWSPHTLPFLFSYQKGWLLYTPMMLLALAGMVLLWSRRREWALPVTVFFVFNLWLTSSWTNWWYAASFGSRAMVQSYGVMLIPLGAAVYYLLPWRRKAVQAGGLGLALFFLLLNQFQTWQYNHKIIHSERMTKAYYWKVFGTTRYHEEYNNLLMIDRGDFSRTLDDISGYKETGRLVLDFENPEQVEPEKRDHLTDSVVHSGTTAFRLDTACIFMNLLRRPYGDISSSYYGIVRIEGWIYCPVPVEEAKLLLVRHLLHKDEMYCYTATPVTGKQHGVMPGQWSHFVQDFITPPVRTRRDPVVAYFWLQGKQPVWIDDVTIRLLEGK